MKQNIKKKYKCKDMRNESINIQSVTEYQIKSENFLQSAMSKIASVEQLKTKLHPNSKCTIINLSITPNSESIRFYSLSELEKLVGKFINSPKLNLIENLENNPVWIQTYFIKEDMHVIPTINIEIIVNREIDELSCDEIYIACLDFFIEDIFISNYIDFVEVNDLIEKSDMCDYYLLKTPIFDWNTFQGSILEKFNKNGREIIELDRILKTGIIQVKDEMIDKKSGSINYLEQFRVA